MTSLKFTFNILFLSFVCLSYSQDKIATIELEKNQKVVFNDITNNGNVGITVWNKKASKNNTKILNYNSNLELTYSKGFKSKFKDNSGFFGGGVRRAAVYYDMYITDNGDYVFSDTDRFSLNDKGELKKYKFQFFDEFGGIRGFLKFVNDDYSLSFGPKVTKSGKIENIDEFYLVRRNNVDFSTETFPIGSVYRGKDEQYNLKLASVNNAKFYTVNKFLNKEKTENNYLIVSYDYQGNVLSEVDIPVTLNKKFFMVSNSGGGHGIVRSYTFNDMHTTKHALSHDSTGNLFIDDENGVVYIYGLYTNKKDKDLYNATYGGFYIHKYSLDGNVLWKLQKPIIDKSDFNKIAVAYFMNVDFFELGNGQLGFAINKNNTKKFAHFFLVNSDDGEIIKKKKIKFEVDKVALAGMKKNNAFPTGFLLKKEFKNANFDINTLFATFINEKVKAYIKNNSQKKSLNFKSKITRNGIYLIEEDLKGKTYSLLKF